MPVWTDPIKFVTFYKDADGDGYGNNGDQLMVLSGSNAPNGYVDNDIDCNDTVAAINPATVWFIGVDADGDGFFGSTTSLMQCESPGTGYVITEPATLDCDDSLATGSSINPNAIEVYGNGIDDDCDGQVDEATVGDLRAGGVVFWVDPTDNMHGLVCAIEDQNKSAGIRWYNGSNIGTVAWSYEIGDGSANTTAIIARQGPVESSYAAGLARAYRGGGFTDWFLPSKDELNQMYMNKVTLEAVWGVVAFSNVAFSNNHFYWSSTENDNNTAWFQNFNDGSQDWSFKYYTSLVRAVRAF
jgi:hypothetical protein